MKTHLLYLGLDVHADSITIALAEDGRDGEVRLYGKVSHDLHALDKVLAKLGHPHVELRVCYEAGPCGHVLVRPAPMCSGIQNVPLLGQGEGPGQGPGIRNRSF